MSSADPLVIFLAGGLTGLLGSVVAEVAASRRQARQLKHDLRMGVRETALKEVGESVDLMFGMVDALIDLRLELQKLSPSERVGEGQQKIQSLFEVCMNKIVGLRSHGAKLEVRFGQSKLIEQFASVTEEFKKMLTELEKAFKQEESMETLPSLKPLDDAMDKFAECARDATGGLSME